MDNAFLRAIRHYHGHEVVGMHNIPRSGRALIVVNHSLATYDIGLLFNAIFDHHRRSPRPLADNLFFRSRLLAQFIAEIGGVQGRVDEAQKLLKQGELVAVAPGGMREGLRPNTQRYQLRWERRKGFIRLALQTRTPIILAMCPAADDIFDVYENPLTSWAYKKMRIPFFLARGIGPTFLPRPVKLIHYVDTPILPPRPLKDIEAFEDQVERLHQKVTERAETLMSQT
jgi:1-acyl-sn-glycerol-3-phosphate acyltransferase